MRHKFLTFFAFPVAVLVVIVVIAVAASSGDSIGSSQTADLATCQSHHAVSGGQWAQIAKDPGSYKGQCVEVYGQ
ncbi:MAG: hypothetical protein J2P26_14745, partial [Nocardiopsaceae bacterium]|nr:hypothetical protein [Nocardiopsaceae bacterium]